MPFVNQIIETSLYVNNIDEAEDFYSNLFGLKSYSKAAPRHVFFKIGEGMLLLFDANQSRSGGSVPAHGMKGQGHVALAIQHDEIDFWKRRLRIQNVAIEQEVTWPSGGKSIYFRDPSGNSLELVTPDTWR